MVRVAAMAVASLDSAELLASCSKSALISCNARSTCAFSRTIPHDSSMRFESASSIRSVCVDARRIQVGRSTSDEAAAVLWAFVALATSSSIASAAPAALFVSANFAALSPARMPKTRPFALERPPRRSAPCIPPVHSPAAKIPETVVHPCWSMTSPPLFACAYIATRRGVSAVTPATVSSHV